MMALAGCLAAVVLNGQTRSPAAEALLGRALHQEDVEANCQAAIKTYKQVLTRHGANRAVAAQAQLHIGACQEKLGDAEAQKAYERVVAVYADQKEVVAEATARLAALSRVLPRTISARQLWSGPETDPTGTPSASGRYLSYVHWDTGDLAVRDLVTGQNRMLTNKGTWRQSSAFADLSVMSADGSRVAYCWDNGKPDPEWAGELRVVSTSGGAPRTIYATAGDYVRPRAWSPDGRFILTAVQKKDTTNELILVPATGGAATTVVGFGKGPANRGDADFSRDGRYVFYDRSGDIFSIPTGGGTETPLVRHAAADGLLGVTPDGAGLLFSSNRAGSIGIWLQRIADGKPQGEPSLIKPDAGPIVGLGVAANGTLFYGLRFVPRDVYQAALDIASGKVLDPPRMIPSHAQGTNSAPDWSADGKLAFKSDRGVFIRDAGSRSFREIVPQMRGFGGLHWTRDGRNLLVAGNKDGVRGLYTIDARTGEAAQVMAAPPDLPIGPARWSPDGNSVFYPSRLEIFRRDLASGASTSVCRFSGDGVLRSFAVSADGKQVACANPRTLAVASVPDGRQRTLLDLAGVEEQFQFNGGLVWTADGKYIVFAKTTRYPLFELWKIPAIGGEPEKIDLGMDNLQEIRLHPDGKTIAFSAGSRRVEIWALENYLK